MNTTKATAVVICGLAGAMMLFLPVVTGAATRPDETCPILDPEEVPFPEGPGNEFINISVVFY